MPAGNTPATQDSDCTASLANSAVLASKLYSWPRSQYYQLLDAFQSTMEQTMSSLLSPARGPQKFHKFSELPPELRIKIWQDAMPAARTVVVQSPFARRREEPAPTSLDGALPLQDSAETWRSNTQIPALLHVNAEARHEALKRYQLSLAAGEHAPRIYVDFSRDTIFFGQSELKPECSSLWGTTKDLVKVQRLAVVPEGAWRVLRWGQGDLNSLEKIIFVHDTDKVHLGPTPQLAEDEGPQEDLEAIIRRIDEVDEEPAALPEEDGGDDDDDDAKPDEDPLKKRMQAAREELDTLMMVLPTQWDKEPVVSTAVFQKGHGDTWTC